jgi:hypothetical protein
MNDDLGNHFKGIDHGVLEILSRYLTGWTEDNHFSQNVPTETRTKNLSNIILEHYYLTSLHGPVWLIRVKVQ